VKGLARILIVSAIAAYVTSAPVTPTWSAFTQTTGNGGNALSAASSFYKAVVLADGPVAYWRLGETTGTAAADVMNNATGEYGGFYTLGATGSLANDSDTAFDTFGAGVLVPDVAALRITGALTVEAWIRPDALIPLRWIWHKNLDYYMYIDNGTTIFGIRTVPATYQFASTTSVTTGAWHHIVGTYDGSTITLYRNGVNVGQVAASGTLTAVGGAGLIGTYDTLGTHWFDGRIDEFAVYAKALTPAQVLNHYQRGALTQ
jgi:hypothetical protein